ncbi:hypothetical protein HN747_00935 [archaeon]|jgi:hypothetical protein|nr:hypothetical protein [archaeon]
MTLADMVARPGTNKFGSEKEEHYRALALQMAEQINIMYKHSGFTSDLTVDQRKRLESNLYHQLKIESLQGYNAGYDTKQPQKPAQEYK